MYVPSQAHLHKQHKVYRMSYVHKQLRNKSKYKDNFYEVFSLSFCEVKCLMATIRRKLDTKLLVQNTPEHYSPNTRYYPDKMFKTHPVTGKTTVTEGAEKPV